MPIISQFLGITISMFWNDHAPPHFHARYGGHEISVTILDGIVEGKFPRRALEHVLEWYTLHKNELADNWNLAQTHKTLHKIDPLE